MAAIKENSDLGRLRALEVGGSDVWPIEKLVSIRSNCSTYSRVWGRKFRTSSDVDARTITVTRLK